jgi:hypothetical protein
LYWGWASSCTVRRPSIAQAFADFSVRPLDLALLIVERGPLFRYRVQSFL